jgi:beta-xylosidase
MFETGEGDWYAVFLARRNINGTSPLGRETFLCSVVWEDDWPIFNNGEPILLNDGSEPKPIPSPFLDTFSEPKLDPSWYTLRTPYDKTYTVSPRGKNKGLILHPNVFSLSERDMPAAVLRKQTSLNMTFSATTLPVKGGLGPRQTVGISAYLSELQHQDIGLSGCAEQRGLCIYTTLINNGTSEVLPAHFLFKGNILIGSSTSNTRSTRQKSTTSPSTYALNPSHITSDTASENPE